MLTDAPNFEYYNIGMLFGNFLNVMRISMGDTAIIAAVEYIDDDLQTSQNDTFLFWGILLGIIIVNCVVFMNFIVAEAANTYNAVNENLESVM